MDYSICQYEYYFSDRITDYISGLYLLMRVFITQHHALEQLTTSVRQFTTERAATSYLHSITKQMHKPGCYIDAGE